MNLPMNLVPCRWWEKARRTNSLLSEANCVPFRLFGKLRWLSGLEAVQGLAHRQKRRNDSSFCQERTHA
jgi:hypothetical protein